MLFHRDNHGADRGLPGVGVVGSLKRINEREVYGAGYLPEKVILRN
jgi:hypothetical protein